MPTTLKQLVLPLALVLSIYGLVYNLPKRISVGVDSSDSKSAPVADRSEPLSVAPETKQDQTKPVSDGHAFMIAKLSELLQSTHFPEDFTLSNEGMTYYRQRLESLQAEFESALNRARNDSSNLASSDTSTSVDRQVSGLEDLQEQIEETRGHYVHQTLLAGYPERSLAVLNTLFDDRSILAGERPPYFNDLAELFQLKGVMHFVIGEQSNCRDNHNSRSCILPFHQDAQHLNPTGATSALKYLGVSLEGDPKNPISLWLYNLANLALGRPADAVPEPWRIPFDTYNDDIDFPYFPERASELSINTQGFLGGANMEDFNGDGLLDLFTTSFKLQDNVRLYLNRGDQGFADITEQAGLKGITGGANTVHADYDNDGDCDLLIVRGGWLEQGGRQPNSLLRNNGDDTFTDVTLETGLLSYHPTHTAAWSDFNNDGYLDLFVGNEHGSFQQNESGSYAVSSDSPDHFSELFVNNGDGTFSEISQQLGVSINEWVKGAVWADLDNNGWQDLYVSCYGAENLVFKNEGVDQTGAVRFTEISKTAGLGQPVHSFPVASFDYNNDGLLDLFVSGYQSVNPELSSEYLGHKPPQYPPCLYLNKGDWRFEEIAAQSGLARSVFAMGLNYGDLDNDGFIDLYAATGQPEPRSLFPNLMFLNDKGRRFLDVTAKGGFGHLQKGHAVAFGDADNDGDQDIYVNVGGFVEYDYFWNTYFDNPGFGNHWVHLKLLGESSNRSAIGARIKLVVRELGKPTEIHRVVSTGGSFGASSLTQEIGLGKADQIETLTIHWPASGRTQVFDQLAADRRYLIRETDDQPTVLPDQRIDWSRVRNNDHAHEHRH